MEKLQINEDVLINANLKRGVIVAKLGDNRFAVRRYDNGEIGECMDFQISRYNSESLTILGYSIVELKDIINFAKERGYGGEA